MQCLMKYRWVKLPRTLVPAGKGIMGSWARLAARAAFRRGAAEYCGHINAVTPGMWAGGVVGLKSILGVRSREKALRTLAALSELGYLQYALDRRTKKLTYEISDWVVECSGAECMDGAVYATNDYGFLCLPRNITERLAAAHYTFEDADAWLDLWCHTVWNDPRNAFSFLTPAIQYRFAGAVLSLETLGQRWGWEKTKVWRFFQKHGDAFALYRLPGSYGCLIFNKHYPAGTAGPVPKEEDIVQLFQRFRAYAAGASCSRSGLNRIIRLYSHSVIAQMGLERQEVPAENRVADLAPIYRAYISLCRNCKNCWNYVYDCRGAGKAAVYAETEIRGPTRPMDLTRMTKELFSYG